MKTRLLVLGLATGLSLAAAACSSATDESEGSEAEHGADDFAGPADGSESAYSLLSTRSGHVAFFDVEAGFAQPSFPLPRGETTLYSGFGEALGTVDLNAYRRPGRSIVRGPCEEVRDFSNKLYSGDLYSRTFLCAVALIDSKFYERDVYVIGELAPTNGPRSRPFVEVDTSRRTFRVTRGVRLSAFEDGKPRTTDIVLRPGAKFAYEPATNRTSVLKDGTAVFYQIKTIRESDLVR